VVLTLDRRKVEGPEEGLNKIREASAYFIQYLKRKGYKVKSYIRVLEWHKDGYPHLHLIIETNKIGMIGGDVIRDFYKLGGVHESYFKSERHFKDMVRYAYKTGYLTKEKDHQSKLPEWAKNKDVGTIRRYEYSQERNLNSERDRTEQDNKINHLQEEYKLQEKRKNCYQIIIENCCKELSVTIYKNKEDMVIYGRVKNNGKIPGEYNQAINKRIWVTNETDLFRWLMNVDRDVSLLRAERYMYHHKKTEKEAIEDFNRGIVDKWIQSLI